jgi:hypothetical protein
MHEVFIWGGDHLDARYARATNVAYHKLPGRLLRLAAAVADSEAKLYDSFRTTNQLEDYLLKLKELSIKSLTPENLGTGLGTGLS